MAVRSRGRPALQNQEADEERQLWAECKNSAGRIDILVAEHNDIWKRMQEIKQLLDIEYSRTKELPSEQLEDELMKLTRENVKICDELVASIEGDSEQDTNSLIGALNLLSALRASSEAESHTPAPRAAAIPKQSRNAKRKGDTASVLSDDRDSVVAESPAAPSPKVHIPISSRLKVNTTASSRAGSVGAGREASVKIEDGLESGIEATKRTDHLSFLTAPPQARSSEAVEEKQLSKEASSMSPSPLDRPRFQVGTEVLYRKKAPTGKTLDQNEGEGILCQVTSVIGEGKQRRYEIRDADPDLPDPQPYRASLQQMTPIPSSGANLPDLKPKSNVLALYPGTTTFYKAEVVLGKRKDGESGPPSGYLRLRFEGEDEADRFEDVERRYVLSDWSAA